MFVPTLTQWRLIRQDRQGDRMPAEKIEAFYKEMPWLKSFMDEMLADPIISMSDFLYLNVQQIYVSGFDRSFLDHELHCGDPFDYSRGNSATISESMWLLDERGRRIYVKKEFTVTRRRFRFFGKKIQSRETVQRFAQGHGILKDCFSKFNGLYWLVVDNPVPARYAVSYCNYTKALIVYRPPRGMSIVEWIKDPESDVDFIPEVKGEIAATDKV